MVRTLAGLKARMFWNGLRSDRQRQIGLPLIFGVVGWAAFRGISAHLSTLDSLSSAARTEYLTWAALVVFVAWAALPVVIFPLDENLDPQQLAVLPVSRPSLLAGLLASGLISPPILGVTALIAFTALWSPAAALATLLAGGLLMLMMIAGAQLFSTTVSSILQSRRGRDVAVFLIMGMGLGSFAGFQIVKRAIDTVGVEAAALTHPIHQFWWAIPPAGPAHTVTSAWSGDWLGALLGIVVSIAWLLVLLVLWERVLSRLLVTPRQDGGASSVRRSNGFANGGWSTPLVVARKELRFYLRDPRQRLVWTGTVIFVGLAVAAIVVGSEGLGQFRSREWLPVIAPAFVLMVGLPVALNQFGWERNAASYLFALPAEPRDVIIGKNLAATTGLLLETVFIGILFAWFSSGWRWLGLVLPLAIGAIACLLAVGNLTSVLAPLRLPKEGTDAFAQSTEQGFLALASQIVSFFVIGLLLIPATTATVLTVEFGQLVNPVVTATIAIVWGFGWYFLSLFISSRLLRRRTPEVVGWVQVS